MLFIIKESSSYNDFTFKKSDHSHFRISDELSCINNTPNVLALIVFIILLFLSFMFLKNIKRGTEIIKANNLLQSETNRHAPKFKYAKTAILHIPNSVTTNSLPPRTGYPKIIFI